MMNNDEVPRGVPPQLGRRPAPTRFQDSRFSSPSTTYNYNSNAGYNQGNGIGSSQHPRRRIDRFKRETINYNDRFVRQNDSIIRLLKEIRDRLPPPPASTVVPDEPDTAADDGAVETAAPENREQMANSGNQADDQGLGDQQSDDDGDRQPE